MNETVKASEITPGMEIEYTHGGSTIRTTVGRYDKTWERLSSVGGGSLPLGREESVTVLSRPTTPPEPKTLGARVKAGDRLFLRVRESGYAWLDVTGGTYGLANTWEEVNKRGPVTVIDGNPSWEVETSEDTPERWGNIEEALKHCNRVVDSEGDEWCYTGDYLSFTFCGEFVVWVLSIDEANSHGPFRRA